MSRESKINLKAQHHTHVGYVTDVSERVLLVLQGKDAVDLLQRISTNDFSSYTVGQAISTCLTNERGRVVDFVTVLRLDEQYLLLSGHSRGLEFLTEWFKKYIVMEDVILSGAQNEYHHYLLYDYDLSQPELRSLKHEKGFFHRTMLVTSTVLVFSEYWAGTNIIHLLVSSEVVEEFNATREKLGVQEESVTHYDNYRVQRFIPEFPNELSTRYNPLEVGLTPAISFSKGCYIGQEVIARLDSYQKIQKKLVQVTLHAIPTSIPIAVWNSSEEVGTITSVSTSSTNITALAMLKSDQKKIGGRLYYNDLTGPINVILNESVSNQ